MRSLCLLALTVTEILFYGSVQARVVPAAEATSFGHLYLLDSNTGHSQRLKRRHVESTEDQVHKVRLDLLTANKVIDMYLKCGSVWGSTSNVRVRNGEEAQQIVSDVPTKCFLSGRLSSGDGYASFSFCNGVNGVIHTDNEKYIIGSLDNETILNDTDSDFPSLPVTISSNDDATPVPTEDMFLDDQMEALELQDGADINANDTFSAENEDDTVESTTSDGRTTKRNTILIRGQNKAIIEIGIYINAGYTKILNTMGLTSVSQIMTWVICRWNLIREVYKNTDSVGIEVDFKIKLLEIWFKSPDYFVPVEQGTGIKDHLHVFCKEAPDDGTDHRVMYTWETKKAILGVSYTGAICRPKSKCSIVIPNPHSVSTELHELGHNLGLPHEPKIKACKWPYGFMGWQDRPLFKDCYRRIFLNYMGSQSFKCLFSLSNVEPEILSYRGGQYLHANQSLEEILGNW